MSIEINLSSPNQWISHDWEYRYAPLVQRCLKKKKGRDVDQKTSQYLVWPLFASCWLWPVEFCPTPLQRLCEVAGYWLGTGTRCRTRRSRASQTCSMGDMSGEYAGHGRTGTISASRNCVQILATWGCAWIMRWWRWINGTTMCLRISLQGSLCIQIAIDKMQLCSLSVTYACPYHNTTGHSVHVSKPLAHTPPYTWSAVVRAVGCTDKFSKTILRRLMVEK